MVTRLALATMLALALASAAGAAAPATRLTISVYPNGTDSTIVHRYRLVCDPAPGTVPRPTRACTALARLAQPFAPVVVRTCAQLSGGPQEAVVTGMVRGRPVSAHLSLADSCQTARWRRVVAVVPGFSDTPGRAAAAPGGAAAALPL